MKEQGGNEKMAFLLPTSPYFAYYKQRLVREKASLVPSADGGESGAAKEQESVKEPVVEKPPELHWILPVSPSTIPSFDFDLIRLVAQYVARNGRAFQMGLWNRESRNPQYAFLANHHPLHNLYQYLVSVYSRLIVKDKEIADRHRREDCTREKVLERIMKRRDWKRAQMKSEDEKKAEEEAERSAASAIDWSDAIIVDSISFHPADDATLPAPIEQTKLLAVYLATKQREEEDRLRLQEEKQRRETEMAQQQQQQQLPNFLAGTTSSSSPSSSSTVPTTHISATEPQTAAEMQRIGGGAKKMTTICPICRLTFPMDEIEAHMKVEMSKGGSIAMGDAARMKPKGPDYAPVVATGEDIASKLAKMARKRTDLFGDEEDDTSSLNAKREERERREREAKAAMAAVSHGYRPDQGSESSSYDQLQQQQLRYQQQQHPTQHQRATATSASLHILPPPSHEQGTGKRPSSEPLEEATAAKKAKVAEVIDLLPEKEWASQHPEPITLVVILEGDTGETKFDISVPIMTSVKALKDELVEKTNIATNKQILKIEHLGFLKDKLTMAHYNITAGTVLQLSTKERGGRKK